MACIPIVIPRGTCSYGNNTHEVKIGSIRNQSKPSPKSTSNYSNLWKRRFLGNDVSGSPANNPFSSFRRHGKTITTICELHSSTGEIIKPKDDLQELLLTLPCEKNWDGTSLYLYNGVWHPAYVMSAVVSFQQHFVAQDTDIILASMPKSGTTWLKALTFSAVNRNHYSPKESPLLTIPPHELVPFFETDLYLKNQNPSLEELPTPRIFGCHSHYASLPQSIRDSKCKIVYICRNPLDQVVSYFHFASKFKRDDTVQRLSSIDEGFENICHGVQSFGPFWDSVLGYWKASLERPDKVLFLKYEDLKEDIILNLKRLSEFLGLPFTEQEEKEGFIEEISRLCSFDNLKELKVNKTGVRPLSGAPNSSFFRKGEVGDWSNYLSPTMAEHFVKIVEEKLAGSGLAFKLSK